MSDAGAVVRAWLEAWNDHDPDALASRVTDDYVHHTMAGADISIAGFQAGFQMVLDAFPDIEYRIDHLLAEGDLAGAYLVSTAHHTGPFIGTVGSGELVQCRGIYHGRVRDGLICEDWDVFDLLNPAFALGAIAPTAH